jgi:ABC-2 type transport system ATP-binding protein
MSTSSTVNDNDHPAIFATQLTKRFGDDVAISDVSFTLPQGKIMALIGPSGCGKTTTVRLTLGIYKPTSGDVQLMGHRPYEFLPKDRQKMGYMPQLFVLYPQLTVWENLNFAASMYGLPLKNRKQTLMHVLEFVDLQAHTHKLARNISGGMQRRLSLAATLVHQPQYVFLDEPTAGIDPVLRKRFWDHFVTLRDKGHTLLVTTQYVGEAAYCDLVGVMAKGKMLMVEPPEKLRKNAYGGEIINFVAKQTLLPSYLQTLQALPFVRKPIQSLSANQIKIIVEEASTAMPAITHWCADNGIGVEAIEEIVPPFDDVFVEIVK